MNKEQIMKAFSDYADARKALQGITKEITVTEARKMGHGNFITEITIPVKYLNEGIYAQHFSVFNIDKRSFELRQYDEYKKYYGGNLEKFLNLPDYSGNPKLEVKKITK